MQTTTIGRQAEEAAAAFLRKEGFVIVDQNWKRRMCEIDIIARKAAILYFVEVKYRASGYAGNGLEYITPKKLKQMQFAAERWLLENDWQKQYYVSAIEVSGQNVTVTEFIPEVF